MLPLPANKVAKEKKKAADAADAVRTAAKAAGVERKKAEDRLDRNLGLPPRLKVYSAVKAEVEGR